jgi:ketosteroid isomerase-like protein
MIDLTSRSGLHLLREVTGLPRVPAGITGEQRRDLVAEEAALRDFALSFAHAVNAADLDAVVAAYADDCTVISPRGQYVGTGAVRRNYQAYFDPVQWFSFWTNVTVRFVRPFDEAYVSAYQYSVGVLDGEPGAQGALSTDVWRVRRAGDSWQIAERRIDILDSHNHRVLPPLSAVPS